MTICTVLIATVVMPMKPTSVEKTAAAELEDALRHIGGAPATWTYHVGATEKSRMAFGENPEWRWDEIGIKTQGDEIVLDGHPTRGQLYAVYTYLEDVLGVRWWTSTETDWPKTVPDKIPHLDLRFAPRIRYRETYYQDGFDPVFKARLKGNFSSRTRYMFKGLKRIPVEMGGDSTLLYHTRRSSSYHTFFEVLPPAVHFKAHPEWYSLVDGKRCCGETGQLCLTNPEMERAFVDEMRRLLRANPDVDFVQISQNDGPGACECKSCRAVEADEGGAHSGPVLRFVNRVAAELEGEFPDVMFDTFAYKYTRKPPKKTCPRRNVTIRLCDIECDFRRPLAELPANAGFMADLAGWKRIAEGQLFFWDYVANFSSYIMPHPNFRSLASNIRLFADAGAIGVFEQGDALCDAGEFWPLRQWMIGHLLWNPTRDETSLEKEFLSGYYGMSAGPVLKRYLDLICTEAARGTNAVHCYHANVNAFLSDAVMARSLALMNEAVAAAEKDGPVFARRVRRERLSTDHMRLMNWKALGEKGDLSSAVAKWYSDIADFGVTAVFETTKRDAPEDYRRLIEKGAHGSQR